jgi:hypothetical protein
MTVKMKRKWGIKWSETLFLKFTNGRKKKRNNQSECTGKLIFIYYRCKPTNSMTVAFHSIYFIRNIWNRKIQENWRKGPIIQVYTKCNKNNANIIGRLPSYDKLCSVLYYNEDKFHIHMRMYSRWDLNEWKKTALFIATIH